MPKPSFDTRLLADPPVEYHEYEWTFPVPPSPTQMAGLVREIAQHLLSTERKVAFGVEVKQCEGCGMHGDVGLYAWTLSVN